VDRDQASRPVPPPSVDFFPSSVDYGESLDYGISSRLRTRSKSPATTFTFSDAVPLPSDAIPPSGEGMTPRKLTPPVAGHGSSDAVLLPSELAIPPSILHESTSTSIFYDSHGRPLIPGIPENVTKPISRKKTNDGIPLLHDIPREVPVHAGGEGRSGEVGKCTPEGKFDTPVLSSKPIVPLTEEKRELYTFKYGEEESGETAEGPPTTHSAELSGPVGKNNKFPSIQSEIPVLPRPPTPLHIAKCVGDIKKCELFEPSEESPVPVSLMAEKGDDASLTDKIKTLKGELYEIPVLQRPRAPPTREELKKGEECTIPIVGRRLSAPLVAAEFSGSAKKKRRSEGDIIGRGWSTAAASTFSEAGIEVDNYEGEQVGDIPEIVQPPMGAPLIVVAEGGEKVEKKSGSGEQCDIPVLPRPPTPLIAKCVGDIEKYELLEPSEMPADLPVSLMAKGDASIIDMVSGEQLDIPPDHGKRPRESLKVEEGAAGVEGKNHNSIYAAAAAPWEEKECPIGAAELDKPEQTLVQEHEQLSVQKHDEAQQQSPSVIMSTAVTLELCAPLEIGLVSEKQGSTIQRDHEPSHTSVRGDEKNDETREDKEEPAESTLSVPVVEGEGSLRSNSNPSCSSTSSSCPCSSSSNREEASVDEISLNLKNFFHVFQGNIREL